MLQEAILEPDLPIIDPHHHLWDRTALAKAADGPPRHPFEAVIRNVPRYLLEELLADMGSGHNLIGTVYVECGAMYRADAPKAFRPVGETEFANGVAAITASDTYGPVRVNAGIVGHVDLNIGAQAREVLQAHITAGGGRFRGIRHGGSHDPDAAVLGPLSHGPAGLYRRPEFREGFAQLAPLGLSFDAWVLEPQLGDVIDLARAFPDTQIILDHVGTPLGIGRHAGRREERFGAWRDNIRELARSANVAVKVGGLAMPFTGFPSFMSDPPSPPAQLAAEWKPYVETCVEAFGADRCMFESNFPVDGGTCAYDVLWNAFKLLAKGCSGGEKADLFAGTARRIYRLAI
jgi:predicted TIM-barrel fold metal-dependent hydrolase